jgi:gamma-glutamylcyclotransferase (GGCT)/AIG2-like uncharacterized protein YtfP
MKLYFAYGANLNLEGMRFRCPGAKPISTMMLDNWRLSFSGVATIQSKPGAQVAGAIWSITQECEDNLDVFEGFPYLYTKMHLTQGDQKFMVYVMNDDPLAPPSKSYYETIAQGYRDWGLPLDSLQRAREQVYLECN